MHTYTYHTFHTVVAINKVISAFVDGGWKKHRNAPKNNIVKLRKRFEK